MLLFYCSNKPTSHKIADDYERSRLAARQQLGDTSATTATQKAYQDAKDKTRVNP